MAERQVFFYECQDVVQRQAFDRLKAVAGINGLSDVDWRVPDRESDLGVLVDRPGTASSATYLRFLRIRSDAPFKLSVARELQPIEVAENENITEFTWAVIWPDGFLAAVSSRDAPGHKKLSSYFHNTSGEQVHIVSLFRPDVVQRLKELREGGLRSVKIKLQTSHIQQIEADERTRGFWQFWRAGRGTEAATIGVELTVGRSGPDATLNNGLGLSVQALADHVDLLESMHVSGLDRNGEKETINIKHERVGGPIDITGNTSNQAVFRAVDRTRRAVEEDSGPLSQAARGT
jgi:hypothetical protein